MKIALLNSAKQALIIEYKMKSLGWEPNTSFEDLLHPLVRKLFLHLKQAILHLCSENQCCICQFLVAAEI